MTRDSSRGMSSLSKRAGAAGRIQMAIRNAWVVSSRIVWRTTGKVYKIDHDRGRTVEGEWYLYQQLES